MHKREQIFQSYFSKWLKNVHKASGAFELKVATGNRLPFSAVQPHQILALENVRHGTFVFKIPDAGYQNPFDCFSFTRSPAWVVIKYERFFCLIAIDVFNNERFSSKSKSLSSERAREIASIIEPV